MSNRIYVKNIKSGIPTNLYNTIQSFPNVQGEPSATSKFLVWDSDQNVFIFSSQEEIHEAAARAALSAGDNLDYDSAFGRFSLSTNSNLDGITGTYGSASQIPVFTVDSHGLIDSIGSVTVAGVTNLTYNDLTGLLSISTADGNSFSDSISLSPFSTTDLAEGTNLYYTTARADSDARNAVDARTDQDLFTTSDVEFAKVTSNLVGSVHFTAKNDEGTALAKGDVVYIKGISGNTPTVAKADADDATKMPAFGVVYSGANNGANVTITTLSVLEGLDTQTPGWSEGDTLYVATVAGELTNTKPTGESSLIQNIGQVTRVDNSAGSIKILGAGRTAATPNLDQNRIFIGNASNQAITMSLDSAVDSDHVQSKIKQSFIDTFDTHDSAAVTGQINSKFANDATFFKDLTVDSDLTVNGVIKGPSTFIIDPALHGDSSGTLVILGNLQVDGVQTIIQSNTVSITDKNIVLADSATNATEANGAGITVNGASASITYVAVGDKWEFNKPLFHGTDRVLTTADDTHDSAAVQGQINSNFAAGFTVGGDITFSDSDDLIMPDKSNIKLGDGADLVILHNGTNSIFNNYTGTLQFNNLQDDGVIVFNTDDGAGGTTNYIRMTGSTGEVQLYHYGSEKLATKSTGINVTGEVLADSATISGTVTANTFSFANWTITESDGSLYFATGGINKMKLDSDGNLDVVGYVNANATIS